MTIELSGSEARRVALAAQGFGTPPPAKPTIRHVLGVARRLGALQLDSVNVLVRAHYLPAFSRIGPYRMASLDELVNVRHDLVELDAHQASLVPVDLEPLLRSRIQGRYRHWGDVLAAVEHRRPGYVGAVERTVVERGPVSLKDLADPGRRRKLKAAEMSIRRRDGQPYAESSVLWGGRSSDGKEALDGLLLSGRLALAGRGPGFERLYDLSERVIPAATREQPAPSDEQTRKELVRMASRALGVATVKDLAGYFTTRVASTRAAVAELEEEGELAAARVEGWTQPAFLHAGADVPASVDAQALISPFDSLTWSRDRTLRLFGFEFSFEIYVPAAKRRYGYYVLPFLLGDRLVARVDLKADRARGVLMVPGAFGEPGVAARRVVPALAGSLRSMASWLELEGVEVGAGGDLSPELGRHLHRSRS